MSGITRYILRQLAMGTLLVSVALVFIVWLTQSLQFLQFIVSKGLSVGAWLKLTVLLLPSFLLTIFPAALFFVILFIYNKLTLDRELVVAQAAGLSRASLAAPAILTATGAAVVGYILSLVIVPTSVKAFKEVQWVLRNDVADVLLRDGAFNQIADGLTVYVRDRGRKGELIGVLVYDTRQNDKTFTFMAERGVVVNSTDGPKILLANGNRQELTTGTGDLSMLYFDSYGLELSGLDTPAPDRYEDNRERSTLDLLRATADTANSAITAARMRAEGHQRLVGPLGTFGYAFVALAFLLTSAFERRGQAGRIGIAVGAAVVFQAAALGAQSLAASTSAFIPLMYIVALLPVAVGVYMIVLPEWRWRHHQAAAFGSRAA